MQTACKWIIIVAFLVGIVVADVRVFRGTAAGVAGGALCVQCRLPIQHRGLALKETLWYK